MFINDADVEKLSIPPSLERARSDVQQLTVQVAPLGKQAKEFALPIKVVVNRRAFHTNHTHDSIQGASCSWTTSRAMTPPPSPADSGPRSASTKLQTSSRGRGGSVRPGEVIVLRGRGHTPWDPTWLEAGRTSCACGKSWPSAPTGAVAAGPIVVMGYHREDAYIRGALSPRADGGMRRTPIQRKGRTRVWPMGGASRTAHRLRRL